MTLSGRQDSPPLFTSLIFPAPPICKGDTEGLGSPVVLAEETGPRAPEIGLQPGLSEAGGWGAGAGRTRGAYRKAETLPQGTAHITHLTHEPLV